MWTRVKLHLGPLAGSLIYSKYKVQNDIMFGCLSLICPLLWNIILYKEQAVLTVT